LLQSKKKFNDMTSHILWTSRHQWRKAAEVSGVHQILLRLLRSARLLRAFPHLHFH